MKKLTILREKLIQETKQLIDEDEIAIHQIEQGSQGDTQSSRKDRLATQCSDFSSTYNNPRTNKQEIRQKSSTTTIISKSNKNIQNVRQMKLKNGEDNLHNLQKTTLRKYKVGESAFQRENQQSSVQFNLHNTLMDIQEEYLNYETKRAQNEYAIDLDMIQEDFAHQQEKNQPQLELQGKNKKKNKSNFIDLLKKCNICQESDLHYASKPFKLTKKLKDIRIMFERKSNNMEQQMKKSNMNKNQIIEDIKADRVVIRKTLPEMAKNYLSEISQKKKINQLMQQRSEYRASKQASQSTPFNQTNCTLFRPDNSKLRLPLSKIGSQDLIVIQDPSKTQKVGDPSIFVDPCSSSSISLKGSAQTTRIDTRFKSTSPFRKTLSHLQESKTMRHTPNSDVNSFQEASSKVSQNNLMPFHRLDYCFSQDNSPYIQPFDGIHKYPPQQQIFSFNNQSKQLLEPSTMSNQNTSITKPSTNSFSTFHQHSTNDLNGNTSNKNGQFDSTIINSFQNLPTDQAKINQTHRHSRSDVNQSNNQISIEKIQYLLYLKNQQVKLQFSSKDIQQLQEFQNNDRGINNKSSLSISTVTKASINPTINYLSNTDRHQSLLKNDSILQLSTYRNSYLQNGLDKTMQNGLGNLTDRAAIKQSNNERIVSLSNHQQNSKQNNKKKMKEGILEGVYKFDEDNYFKHQSIYKFEQEKAQIVMIRRNQTHARKQIDSQKNGTKNQNQTKKNESYFHDEYSSNDDSIPSATEAQLDNCYEESKQLQRKVLKLSKGDLQTKIKSLLRIENINNEINKLVQWKMKK